MFVAWLELKVVYPAPFVIELLLRDMFPVPSKETPAIVLAFASLVAVAALPEQDPDDPVVFWFSVGTLEDDIVPEDILLAFKFVRDAPEPLNVPADNTFEEALKESHPPPSL